MEKEAVFERNPGPYSRRQQSGRWAATPWTDVEAENPSFEEDVGRNSNDLPIDPQGKTSPAAQEESAYRLEDVDDPAELEKPDQFHTQGGYGQQSDFPPGSRAEQIKNRKASHRSGEAHRGRFLGRNRPAPRSDERLLEEVSECLWHHPEIDSTEIEVQVASGVVTLSGNVPSEEEKRRAESFISELDCIAEIKNELRVQKNAGVTFGNAQASTDGIQFRFGKEKTSETM